MWRPFHAGESSQSKIFLMHSSASRTGDPLINLCILLESWPRGFWHTVPHLQEEWPQRSLNQVCLYLFIYSEHTFIHIVFTELWSNPKSLSACTQVFTQRYGFKLINSHWSKCLCRHWYWLNTSLRSTLKLAKVLYGSSSLRVKCLHRSRTWLHCVVQWLSWTDTRLAEVHGSSVSGSGLLDIWRWRTSTAFLVVDTDLVISKLPAR